MKISKRKEQAVRDGIIRVCTRICASALHISAVTKTRDIVKATQGLSPEEFLAVTGISQAVWLKLVASQNQNWLDLIQANFELQIDRQTREVAQLLEAA